MHAVLADPQTDLRKQKKLKSEDKIKTTHETFCRKTTSSHTWKLFKRVKITVTAAAL